MKRFFHIDFLRGTSIFIVIIIHVLQFNLNNIYNLFFWNYLHFVVIAFIFCSAFVLEVNYGSKLNSLKEIIIWWKKRFIRLLVPLYIYIIIHYLLWNLFPDLFNGFDLKNNFLYLKDTVLLIGGVSANWLPLLFIQLALFFPLLKIILKINWLLIIYTLFSFIITGIYTYSTITGFTLVRYYRVLMIIPYSLVALLAMKCVHKETAKKYLLITLIFFISFYLLILIWPVLGKIRMLNQKYPPNFYYLFYGITMTNIIILFSYIKIFQNKIIKKFIIFSSSQAYNLFFISYIVNDFIQKQREYHLFMNNVFFQLLFVIFISYFIGYLLKLLGNENY